MSTFIFAKYITDNLINTFKLYYVNWTYYKYNIYLKKVYFLRVLPLLHVPTTINIFLNTCQFVH